MPKITKEYQRGMKDAINLLEKHFFGFDVEKKEKHTDVKSLTRLLKKSKIFNHEALEPTVHKWYRGLKENMYQMSNLEVPPTYNKKTEPIIEKVEESSSIIS